MSDQNIPAQNDADSEERPGEEDEFRLAPIETESYEENRVRFLKQWFESGEKIRPPRRQRLRFQFSLGDLLLISFGVALAFLGFGGEPSRARASLLALLLVALMVLPILVEADGRLWRALWLVLLTAYAIAAAVVLVQA